MSTRTSVIHITKNMQLCYSQTLYDIRESYDKIISTISRDYLVDDNTYITSLILFLSTLMKQFLKDIGILWRQ